MALDRLLPVSTTPGAITGDNYMDAVQEEVTGLWDRARIKLSGVSGTNTITATYVPALTAGLVDGMNVLLRPVATNTGAATLNGVSIKDGEGTALNAGALRNGGTYDLVYVSSLTSWIMVGYHPGASLGTGAKFIKTVVASSSATVDFVNGVSSVVMDDTYDAYEVIITTLRSSTDAQNFLMRVGTGAGPTYQATNYHYAIHVADDTGAGSDEASTTDTAVVLGYSYSNTAGENGNVRVEFADPEVAQRMIIRWHDGHIGDSGALLCEIGSGYWSSSTAITAIRFLFASGNIATGRFSLYGRMKI